MVTHVTDLLHGPAYGRRMAAVTALVAVVLAFATGLAGDFLMLLTSGIAIGAWIASGVVLLVRRRARRHIAASKLDAARDVNAEDYLLIGGLAGGAIGLVVAIADSML